MEDIEVAFWDTVRRVGPYLEDARVKVNTTCQSLEAWQIIAYTFGFTLILMSVYNFLFDEEKSLKARVKKQFFKYVKKLPIIRTQVAKEIDKTTKGLEEEFHKGVAGMQYVQKLPAKGLSEVDLKKELHKYQSLVKIDWSKGRVSGAVYNGGEELTKLLVDEVTAVLRTLDGMDMSVFILYQLCYQYGGSMFKRVRETKKDMVYGMFTWTNPLHPDLFPDIRKIEAEVVRMCCSMFNGGPDTCGTVTSGGTESILLACLAYRNLAHDRGIRFPEMIVAKSAHAAFDKAADFFHMKITHIPCDPKTCKVDVKKMRRAINGNTCMLVGSAPSFPHGVIDDLEAITALGRKYNIPVHCDCCLGGFLVPFMDKAGFPVPKSDFRLPGITSISCDTHKYGFAPKGSSVILYSDKSYRKYQYFVQTDWTGGIYASPTLAGSRSGAVIASCWAAMMHFGEDGYVQTTKKIITTARYIEQELRKIPNIYVMGKPDTSVVAINSDKFNIFRLSDALASKGWSLNPLQFPSSIHICVTLLHSQEGVADRFIAEVKDAVAEISKDLNAKCGGVGAIYGMSQSIPDRSLVSEITGLFLDACYSTKDPENNKVKQNGTH